MFQKTRKHVTDLDDFVNSEDEELVGVRLPKRSHNTASPAPARSALPPDARPGWLYRIGQSPAGSSAKAAASTPRSATSASSVPPTNTTRASLAGPQRTPSRLSVGKSASPITVGSTSRTTTPFKPPSFVKSSNAGSPQPAAPSSVPRRTLGSTRPSSLLARQALQSEWSKYADQLPKITTKSTPYKNTSSRSFSSPAQTDEHRAANLEKFRKQAEPDIVPVNRNRRDGEEGDPSSWLFGDL